MQLCSATSSAILSPVPIPQNSFDSEAQKSCWLFLLRTSIFLCGRLVPTWHSLASAGAHCAVRWLLSFHNTLCLCLWQWLLRLLWPSQIVFLDECFFKGFAQLLCLCRSAVTWLQEGIRWVQRPGGPKTITCLFSSLMLLIQLVGSVALAVVPSAFILLLP